MRLLVSAMLLVLLAGSAPSPAQPPGTQTKPKDQYLTGLVVNVSDASLTVSRTGKNALTKTFVITTDTRFEGGRPAVGAQVTVRYFTADDGDHAVRVLLRRSPK